MQRAAVQAQGATFWLRELKGVQVGGSAAASLRTGTKGDHATLQQEQAFFFSGCVCQEGPIC